MADLKFAWRALWKNRGFATVAILTLAIAVGGTSAIYSVLNAVVLRPLPYPNAEELVIIRDASPPRFPSFSVSPGRFLEWQTRTHAFSGIVASQGANVNLTGDGEPLRLRAALVSSNYFTVLGTPAIAGRVFSPDDEARETPTTTVVISEGLWRSRFGGETSIAGRKILIDDKPMTIVGVIAPPAGTTTQLWSIWNVSADERRRYGSHYLQVLGRMKPGVRVEDARADLLNAAREIEPLDAGNKSWTALLDPLLDYSIRNVRAGLWVLSASVGLVLLIACANIANLLLARGVSRQRELGVRAALGASRARLARQMFVENLLLGGLGSTLGLVFAWGLLRLIIAGAPADIPRIATIGMDGATIVFTALMALVTPILFGLLPTIQVSRADLQAVVAQGGRAGGTTMRARTRAALIVAEVAVAVMLVAGSTLFIRSFTKLINVSPGYDASRALIVGLSLPSSRYESDDKREQFWAALVDRVNQLPGVEAAGVSQSVPLLGDFVSSIDIPGKIDANAPDRPATNFYGVSPGYFKAMGIPLLRGRGPLDSDTASGARVIVISKTLADRHFEGEDPIGKQLRVGQGPRREPATIIGIAGDIKQYDLASATTLQVYEPVRQHAYFGALSLIVRTTSAPEAATAAIRAVVRDLDPALPIASARTMEDVVNTSVGSRRFTTTILASFAGVALLLSAIGVYGL
ncbi:MAG TPA: ABC transporter permease, partial [Vicinamibacterales bacterium]|nr:ABC transporter permease [Vicinamibacterales bacterium]